MHVKNTPLAKDVRKNEIVRLTEGFVGADIRGLVREASMNALRKDMKSKEVKWCDFEEAFKKIKPSVSKDTAKRYRKLEEHYTKNAKLGSMEIGPIYTG